jgi:hypothetical protein
MVVAVEDRMPVLRLVQLVHSPLGAVGVGDPGRVAVTDDDALQGADGLVLAVRLGDPAGEVGDERVLAAPGGGVPQHVVVERRPRLVVHRGPAQREGAEAGRGDEFFGGPGHRITTGRVWPPWKRALR